MENVNLNSQESQTQNEAPQLHFGSKKLWLISSGILIALLVVGSFVYYLNRGGNQGREIMSPFEKLTGGKKSGGVNAKDVQNPITGVLYTAEEAASWINTRPLGVMINNHVDARPQSGLDKTDVVYEIIAEGGITRFLAFFFTNTPEKIGPVRSAREYYLVIVKELGDAMLMHIGWSPQALVAIESWPVRSLGRGGGTFWRDTSRNVATEHTAYTNGVDLRKVGISLGWEGRRDFESWKFKNDREGYSDAAITTDISVDFWYKGDYSVIWKYNPDTNTYLRFMGYDAQDNPIPHVDNETKEQLKAKNVIVQFASESSIKGDEKNRLAYQLTGSGKGLAFIDGKVIQATWSKESRDARTKFYDLNGQEIAFNRGNFWVSIVADRNFEQVVYK